MVPAIAIRQLRKRYGAVEAVRDVSFHVEQGEIFGVLGPNGAGKTTTIECILGLREPDKGTIEVQGVDARAHPDEVKHRVGAALQSSALQDKITPREALTLFGSFYRRASSAVAMLERFGLSDKADVPFDSLSGGQRQRLALALAFVHQPDVVILDEPTAGLDATSRRALHDEIRRMKRDGRTVLLTTHYIEEAAQLCDRIAILDRGCVVATGRPSELIERSTASKSVSLVTTAPIDLAAVQTLPAVTDVVLEGNLVRFTTSDTGSSLFALMGLIRASRVQIVSLHVNTGTLEDVFLALTRAEPPK